MNPLLALNDFGQSIWFDYIRRNLLVSGELERLIRDDGLKGMTSNPAIFQKAIAGSSDYADTLTALADRRDLDTQAAYEHLALEDIRRAADIMRPVFVATGRRDGYVSLEVSPRLANDTQGTVDEARRLWRALDRENVMIKVPATPEGLPAIETLLGEGININVTLLFSLQVYEQVVEAYLRGLEKRLAAGSAVGQVASVASFFISRIDTAVDNLVEARLGGAGDKEHAALLPSIEGKVAIASAKLTYQRYKQLFSGERWQALADQGAQTQRLLWASTGVKNPAYRDVRYIEELIGPDTVNTVPPATMDAFRNHGQARSSLEEDVDSARAVMDTAEQLGIPLDEITEDLLKAGVRLFVEAFDRVLGAVRDAREATQQAIGGQSYRLPSPLNTAVGAALDDWQQNNKVCRLWARDAWLWTGRDEARWMDWLEITCDQLEHLGDLRRISRTVEGHHFTHAVLLGMGGSSLAPEVIRSTFGDREDYPRLHVLDSTDPAQVADVEAAVDLSRTLFLVSSKSGSTLEPNILLDYFFDKVCEAVGKQQAGRHFAAVTDPGSQLEQVARDRGFRRVFYGVPGIGGRYSALSNFGIVPAAGMGVDVARLLDNAEVMVEACAGCVPARDNPGVVLGAVLGTAANQGRDKLTLIVSPGIASLGAWLEQLVAESTGKEGKGIIPVDAELTGAPAVYGDDRLFAYLRLDSAADAEQDAAVDRLEQAGHAVLRINVPDIYKLGQEFFRWEIATAVAGSIMGINPFNQPDVEASKVATRKLTEAYAAGGSLPEAAPLAGEAGLQLYTDAANAAALTTIAGEAGGCLDYIRAHLGRIGQGDYFALLAYLNRNDAHTELLQAMRHAVRDHSRVATCLGFGPRFLHSTGQAYKGGPNSGVFLQITCDDARDLAVPGDKYSFGVVKAAQAQGDFEVLAERKRRALRVHLGEDTIAGLARLRELIGQALTA